MANHIKRGESILIPFCDGMSISDSQMKPRMYKTKKAFEKAFPKHYLGTDGVELVEYAEVRHGRWMKLAYDPAWTKCSECGCNWEWGMVENCNMNFCPNCGAKMDLEVDDT